MSMKELAEDFERLQDAAMKITWELEDSTKCPSDAIMVLGMIAAYFMNTQRQAGKTLEEAQTAYFNLVKFLAGLGEKVDKDTLQ